MHVRLSIYTYTLSNILFMKILLSIALVVMANLAYAQACTPAGNETTYGNSNTWIGYIYDNMDLTAYHGYVNEGSTSSPNFDESFGGSAVNYPTNGCDVYTESFSARYRLTKTFAPGMYQFTVGADDGYRLSIDGGATWIINKWNDQSYTYTAYAITMSGTYNLVLEYYENSGGNRVSFSLDSLCVGTENQLIYGIGGLWKGYIYTGTNFNNYAGLVSEGIAGNPNFDEGFGGDDVLYTTSACGITTEQFSARYRLQQVFAPGTYTFTVGGDDGYRLSMDGGSTWVISNWGDHGYTTSSYSAPLNGTYNMVLEYYENGGGNRLSFAVSGTLLPVTLLNFTGKVSGQNILLNWTATSEINADHYEVERSADGQSFIAIGQTAASSVAGSGDKTYGFTDAQPLNGMNNYRLRMVDKDGRFSYSPVVKVIFLSKKEMQVYPSLITGSQVYISTPAGLRNGMAVLFDMMGRKIQETALPARMDAGATAVLGVQKQLSGSYVLLVMSGGLIQARQQLLFP